VPGTGLRIGLAIGDFDEAAVYPSALSPDRIAAHWTRGGSTATNACAPTPTSGHAQAVLANSPDLYLRLGDLVSDSSDRVAFDSSGGCHNGAYADQALPQRQGALLGDPDGAFTNPGGASYGQSLVTQSGANLPAGSKPRTLELWYRSTNAAGAYLMVYGDGNSAHFFGLFADGDLKVNGEGGTLLDFVPTRPLYDGAWHLLDVTYDGTVATVYMDGQVIGQGAIGALATVVPGTGLRIGLAVGDFDEAAVYPSALTASQVVAHFQAAHLTDSATVLSSNINPSAIGQPVTFTALVVAGTATITPTGSVTFFDGANVLGTATLTSISANSASATFTTSTLAAGSHSITAAYSGDGNVIASTSLSLTQIVTGRQATSTTLTSSVNPSVFGQPVTFTATVAPVGLANGVPQGTVTFNDGTTTLATVILNNGQASFTTSALAVGSHTITATYNGSTSLSPSTSAPLVQQVNRDNTTTTVVSSVNPSVFGQPVTFTASVTANPPGSGVPTGLATFFVDGKSFAAATLSGGQASVTTTGLAVGSHTVMVTYGGDGNFNASASASLTQTVNQAATATMLSSSANPSVFGQPVTFTATVSVVLPGAGAPTGTVTFKDGTTILGSAPLSGSLQASLTTSALQVGTHTITATYSGDGNFLGSTSAPLTQVVGCTSTITGVRGGLTVTTGSSTCVVNGSVTGGITVQAGAALSISNSTVNGAVTSTGAAAITVCNSTLNGATTVTGTTGFVLIGDGGDDGSPPCAGNNLAGMLTLDSNTGQVEFGRNTITGGASLTNTSGSGPTVENSTSEIEGNIISGDLACSGNTPAPTNDGQPNTVTGTRSGQCASPGF